MTKITREDVVAEFDRMYDKAWYGNSQQSRVEFASKLFKWLSENSDGIHNVNIVYVLGTFAYVIAADEKDNLAAKLRGYDA